MLDNQTYDLINQLTQESKSLWRISNEYIPNAEGNDKLVQFWQKMEADKQAHIQDLTNLIQEVM